jgi:V/A-type H+-transporting ATPase subunit A
MMVDSISRWAEALREISARLQDMPGEEGFPPYLASRLGRFFERSGRVQALGSPPREAAVTIISAISPPGGDFSEPVTQAALRVTGALWALDPSLAHQRHFPAVDWSTSYSLYADTCSRWFAREVAPDWHEVRGDLMALLQHERELRDVAALVGPDALEPRDRFVMDVARIVREVLLQQNAFHPHDASSSVRKTYALASAVRNVHRAGLKALDAGVSSDRLHLDAVRQSLVRLREAAPETLDACIDEAAAAAERLAHVEKRAKTSKVNVEAVA